MGGNEKNLYQKMDFFNDPISNQYMDLFDFEFSKKAGKGRWHRIIKISI